MSLSSIFANKAAFPFDDDGRKMSAKPIIPVARPIFPPTISQKPIIPSI